MILPITLVIAGAAAIINIWLSVRVSQLRRLHKVSVGDGGNVAVLTRMRAHGNFAETTPIFLILLGLIELATGSAIWLWVPAILFILARLAHPFGLEREGANPLRLISITVTWLVLLGLAICAIVLGYSAQARPTQTITYAAVGTPA